MQSSAVTADDLRQAKAMPLREIPLSEASVERITAELISRTTLGLPLDEPTRAASHHLQLTSAE